MNWYILFCLSLKTEKLSRTLNKNKDIHAFIPQYEYYRRDIKDYAIKPMFPGYLFVQTDFNQKQFDEVLFHMYEEKDGLIKQLKHTGISALLDEEVDMFERLLDTNKILRMSQAYLENGKAVVYNGPLQYFEKDIKKIDKHNQLAYLDLTFLNRYIQAGLLITSKI